MMIKVMCIKDLISFTEKKELMLIKDKIYEAEINFYDKIYEFTINCENGWRNHISRTYVIPYKEWLANWREQQINSILND